MNNTFYSPNDYRALRAYYGHGGNWSGWAQKNTKHVKQYGGKG